MRIPFVSASLAASVLGLVPSCVAPCRCPEPEARAGSDAAGYDDTISGWVRDEEGRPLAAEVRLVRQGGSWTRGIGAGGSFSIAGAQAGLSTLVAVTRDGRIACRGGVATGTAGWILTPGPGARVRLQLSGRPRARVALLAGDPSEAGAELRVHDFTLVEDQSPEQVVPPGSLLVRLYEGDVTLGEERLELAPGATREVLFTLAR